MKVQSLEIQRRESYDRDFPNQLIGMVELKGPNGEQKIRLTNESMVRIFSVIADQVAGTARQNAAAVPEAISDAKQEPLMIAAAEKLTIDMDIPF